MFPTQTTETDQALVAEVLAGNESAAVRMLSGRCGERLSYLAQRFSYPELPHDLFLAIREDNWRRLRTWSGSGSLAGWLCRISVNLCLERCRRPDRLVPTEAQVLEHLSSLAANESGSPEDAHVQRAKKGDLMKALAALKDPRQRLILHLSLLTIPPWEMKAIASLLRLTDSNASVLKHRALKEMKASLLRMGWEHA